MDPTYKYIPSYPYQRDQIHYGPNYYPGTEPLPAHMYMNPGRPPVHYDYQPWGSDFGHTSPVVCNGCCNHTHFPTHYAWRPPYPHFPPSYPPFPVQYMPSPNFPTMEHPRVGFETIVPSDHHCCGCPNHVCNRKEQRSVKIEEEEPDIQGKMNAPPFQLKNSPPYPIVWLPPDHSNDKEHGKPVKLDTKDGPIDANKPHENRQIVEQKPGVWNGWYPFDLNNLGLPKKKGEKEPFPVIWMPYKPEEKENEALKENNVDPKLESEKGSREHTGGQVPSTVKDIPVKDLEQHKRNVSSRNEGKVLKDNVTKGKSSSPPKSSKLPPVCLRVDPLPKKKCSNGSSQSPSPLGAKQNQNQNQNQLSSQENKVHASTTEEKRDKGVTKTIKVVDGNPLQGESKHVKVSTPVNQSLHSQEAVPKNQTEEENIARITEGQSIDAESAKGENGEHMKTKGSRKKIELSKEEAAVIIQAAYRGYETRRWEPVKKLKQIAKVRERMAEVKHLIEAMESSSDIQAYKKKRTIITETIMSLLLDLDTIQGLHPSIREVRKSVVRELVGLQEKLDSLFVEQEGSVDKNLDVISSQDGNETLSSLLVEPCHNPLNGGSLVEVPEPSATIENDAEEFSQSKTVEGTMELESEPIITIENDQINEDVNEEISVATRLEDNDNWQSSECSIPRDNTVEVTEFAPNNETMVSSELAELPEEEIGDLHKQQGTDHDADKSKVDPPKQEEGYVTSESNNEIRDEGNKEYMGLPDEFLAQLPQEHSDDIFDHSETPDKRELCVSEDRNEMDTICNMLHENDARNSLIQEEVEEALDTPSEEEQNTEQASRLIAGMTREVSVEGKTIQVGEIDIRDSSNEVCEEESEPTQDSSIEVCEKASEPIQDSSIEVCEKASEPTQDSSIEVCEEESEPREPIEVCEKASEPAQDSSVEVCEGPSEPIQPVEVCEKASEPTQDSSIKVCEKESEPTQDSSIEVREGQSELTQVPDDNLEARGSKTATRNKDNYEELKESNEKLIEENEKLRDMMEKLIKSGQEQLNAISNISGRVKDLERKLTRKKKLKIKQSRGPKAGLFSMTQMFDS
ncbi:hypothetical protein ACJIZ3_018512 [Penstemon smallii]|uniref:BAG domain-containing protein n=1 Tax=Penstemon smallii TaxID=265156 RepID=A0ABD3SZ28_9LAMI